ncbi:hypothetical protein M422DRAFT_269932 [Sphaerobolus stellatus SS14]|uniref:Uncharacterized protein n=1 Tax=Sphaerobolus stellatus (strain SS14) TaxID=990650 RepID=A0A0C9U3D6_SPHS4|nr:hypothetical protein M422DRAFT_269932 [Sphaerobolus stellatus SS14]
MCRKDKHLEHFQLMNWPSLPSLSLSFLIEDYTERGCVINYAKPTTASLHSFFTRHRNLTALVVESKHKIVFEVFTPDILPHLHIFGTNHLLHEILSISLAAQLPNVCTAFDANSREHLQSMTRLTQCVARVETELDIFLEDLSPGIQKLILDPKDTTVAIHDILMYFSNAEIQVHQHPGGIWTESLPRLLNITHLGGIPSLINPPASPVLSIFKQCSMLRYTASRNLTKSR